MLPTPLCTSCTRRSLSPYPNLNLNHYSKPTAIFQAAYTIHMQAA
ncbi:cation-transporting ATPase [Kingella kingae]|nr:cation-transporting ATPase [Kingella kingae]